MAGTRAFQQAALFVAAIALAGAVIVWALLEHTSALVSRQVIEAMTAETDAIATIAEAAGPTAAVEAVSRRAKDAGNRLYLLESTNGTWLAGNLARWPGDMPRAAAGAGAGGTFEYRPAGGSGANGLAAGVARQLASGMSLLVGRDLEPQRALARQVRWTYIAGFGALMLAGLLAGLLASRMSLGRVAEIAATSDQIITGDLSGRVRIAGSGDELDRLAGNLNAMLDRIESLMAGLREVSDNIAHDLKTPLTRLRARAEAALRDGDSRVVREGLGHVIEDADELIKTFNALLLIARLEAGSIEATAETFDLSALVRDVAELYEPVAEEAGLSITCRAERETIVRANRHLVGQAVANLIDNAIKYGSPSRPGGAHRNNDGISIVLDADEATARVAVGDRGPGIPIADRERVLKRFVRLEASRTRPGTGLGLSLVAAVARLHGGSIELHDNAPGLRVVVVFPRHHGVATKA